jgi:hypothetical protein
VLDTHILLRHHSAANAQLKDLKMINHVACNIADTILNQLGGNRMAAMTGAKNFVVTSRGLRFTLPRNLARNGINMVQVNLNDCDLYNIHFMKATRLGIEKIVAITEDVGADMLKATFAEETGLAVSL